MVIHVSVAGMTTSLVEQRLQRRLLQSRFSLLKLLLDAASSKDSGPQVRAKCVKAVGEVVRVDARLLWMAQVKVCLCTAMQVGGLPSPLCNEDKTGNPTKKGPCESSFYIELHLALPSDEHLPLPPAFPSPSDQPFQT